MFSHTVRTMADHLDQSTRTKIQIQFSAILSSRDLPYQAVIRHGTFEGALACAGVEGVGHAIAAFVNDAYTRVWNDGRGEGINIRLRPTGIRANQLIASCGRIWTATAHEADE
jgi:hypothetical protein